MGKKVLLIGLVLIGFSACVKDSLDSAQQAATDDALIQSFIRLKHLTPTKDPSGLYYQVLNPGNGAYPSASSTINVTYTGSMLDGLVFSPISAYSAALSSCIRGWQIGLAHIRVQGTIILLIPSALAYGNGTPNEDVQPNSSLVYNITLNGVTN
jgi:FKBP-type peptidyl-prolyl cis-trans isomerase